MSFQVSTASVQEFKTIVSLLLQQQGSRLRPAVNVQAFVGKALVMKRFHARARGRAGRVEKPFSNLTIIVREVPASAEA